MRIELALENTYAPEGAQKDFKVTCRLADSDMVAYARIETKAHECGVAEYHILEQMYKSGVREGILLDNIQDMVRKKRYGDDVMVAAGEAPIHGKDSELKHVVELGDLPDYEKLQSAGMAASNKGTMVEANALLAQIIPNTIGKDGFTVKGRTIEANHGKKIDFKAGDNVLLSEDGMKFYSVFSGYAGFRRGKLSIDLEGSEDFKSYIHFSKNKMDATLVITPGSKKKYDFSENWYRLLLETHGICFGVNETVYRTIPKKLNGTYTVKVAEGLHPIKGINAALVERYREHSNNDVFIHVSKGDLLVEKKPAKKGFRGKNVLGEMIPYSGGQDVSIQHGSGTSLSEDGTKLYADDNGYISFVGGKYSVIKCSDVNCEHEKNEYASNEMIRINGDVPKGISIKSDHHIEIVGNVHSADIVAGGILCVRGAVKDCKDKTIQSGHDMVIEHASNARLWSGKNIYVKNHVENCELIAGGGVFNCHGTDCTLSGCRVVAEGEDELVDMGLVQDHPTSVLVGVPEPLKEDYHNASKEIIDSKNKLKSIGEKLSRMDKSGEKNEELRTRLANAETMLRERLKGGREKLSKLEASIITISEDGTKISSRYTVNSNAVIQIGDKKYTAEADLEKCILNLSN